MSSDPGETHYVGDGCQPAHDPAIDQTPPEVTFDELHAEYLREIASKVRAEAEVERLRAALELANAKVADLTTIALGAGHAVERLQAELHAERMLRAALRTILEDPDATLLDTDREVGWEALGRHKSR